MFRKIYPLFLILLLSACLPLSVGAPRPDLTLRLDENRRLESVWIPTPTEEAGWRIGFDPRLEPKDDVRQAASLADWLARKTGLSFSVHVSERDGNVVDDLCAGKVDFAIVGTVSYLQANDQCGASILVRGRNAEGDELITAIRTVHNGGTFLDPAVAGAVVGEMSRPSQAEADPFASLSEREREVLVMLARGETYQQIAEALFISPKTVDYHRANLMRKLKLDNRTELTRYALQRGLV